MYTQELIRNFWLKTRPNNPAYAQIYLNALLETLAITKEQRYKDAFPREKKSGGTRMIIPAKGPLKIVQIVLSDWVKRSVKLYDYCWLGGSNRAAEEHKLFTGGICLDLSSAFNQVTESHIRRRFNGMLQPDLLELFIELVTLNGVLPQGCGSSLFVFDAVFGPLDLKLQELKKRYPDIVAVTRYVDNICISVNSSRKEQIDWIADAAVKILAEWEFHGILQKYYRAPLVYLGLHIFPKRIELNTHKFDDIVAKVVNATNSATPESHRKTVIGCLVWVIRVYGDHVPEDIVKMFEEYFKKAGPNPNSLNKVLLKKRESP